ncbi:von Willebrand factor type A domain protein [uncultured archaeon]|nr:von Willebrand factor type A domain protein [uncultured archaeon]
MKHIRLLLSLSIMALACLHPGAGLDSPSEKSSDRELVWYSSEAPVKADQLLDQGQAPGKQTNSSLWIVDSTEKEKRTSQEVSTGSWAKMMLLPAAGGELALYCRYPTGSTDLILKGTVEEGKAYEAWFSVDLEGDYEVWYTANGSKSNTVLFQVQESQVVMNESMPGMSKGLPAMASYGAAAPALSRSIGFSTGGAKDINNFRENIEQGYLPLPTDVTYEGLFYDYYFDTGALQECKKLFCPSYSYAVSKDPISGEPQYYLSVGLNSGLQDFQRKKLNLVVVLDYSGSMGSPFDQYYYDRFGNKVELKADESGKTKMQIADESVVALLSHLKEGDRFGLVIFSNDAFLVDPLTPMEDKDLEKLKSRILEINETYGTNMEAGMEKGTSLFERFLQANKSEYENRIIFLTDAMPNIGETGDLGLFRMLEDNSDHGIYTTLIGMGVDFNTELVEAITKIKGANYYSVHSAGEFKERMDDEFDFMVTPLVFDLRLGLEAPGYKIEKVYGSPEADQATGELMKVNTLFPSKAEAGQVKGGVILVKLKKLSPEGDLKLKVSYLDRNGVEDSDQAKVQIVDSEPDFYQNSGIRKAVLLSRYVDLLKDWMIDERSAQEKNWKVVPSVTLASGIIIPVELGEWERQSMPLQVSQPYRELFRQFQDYFQKEMQAVRDDNLQQEQEILQKLSEFKGAGTSTNGA